jgi:hypothetical protein
MRQRKCKQCGKKYKPLLEKQEDCSEICLANRFDRYVKKSRKLAKIFAATMGYRSMSEVRFASKLKDAGLPFEYEKHKFKYQYKPQSYTVDFTLREASGNLAHFEYKGKLDGPTRKKLRAIKDSNPELDLRLVFEKPNNKLYKGAKMRYWEWADRYNFVWYDCRSVDKLKQDLKEKV